MKNYLKAFNLNRRELALVLAILVLGLFIRLYNFENRITYGPEQAISLLSSGSIANGNFTLKGIENVQRVTSTGHKIFSGAFFSYSLVPLQLLFNFDPLPITYYFAFLNVGMGLVLFIILRKTADFSVAIFTLGIFIFNSFMINLSMYIWILDYYPLIGILTMYLIYQIISKYSFRHVFILGIVSGLGINLEYLYLPVAILLGGFVVIKSKNWKSGLMIFIAGVILGNLPMILFDLRHDFYHTRTVIRYVLDTIRGLNDAGLSTYHFLFLWPLLAAIGGFLVSQALKYNRLLTTMFIIVYLFTNLNSKRISFTSPVGMPRGLVYQDYIDTSAIIAADTGQKFNVVTLLDFDTRGNTLRYPLEYIYHKTPLGVEDYPQSEVLYALARKDYDFEKSKVWEVTNIKPYSIIELDNIGEDYALFKLTKNTLSTKLQR